MTKMITTCMAVAVLLTSNTMADSAPENISAHLAGAAQSLDSVKSKLTANGFTIVATTNVLKGEDVITVTNDELKATNTYMATLNVLVDTANSQVSVQNPSYLGAAYLGDNFKYGQFKATKDALTKALGTLTGSAQKAEFDDLEDFRFMFGMPRLDDTIEVASVSKAPSNKHVAYTLTLPNGAIIIGHNLRSKTNKFLKKLDATKNADLLPYESMIKDGEATMLDPKYYLALSLPNLSMGEFMKIASVPDAITKDIKRAYK